MKLRSTRRRTCRPRSRRACPALVDGDVLAVGVERHHRVPRRQMAGAGARAAFAPRSAAAGAGAPDHGLAPQRPHADPRRTLVRVRLLSGRDLAAVRASVAAAQRAVEKLVSFAERVVPADGGTLFGAWCIADTDLAMMLQRLVKTNEPLPARLRAFAEREWRRPSVQAFVNASRPPHRPALT